MTWLTFKILIQEHLPKILVILAVLAGLAVFGGGVYWFRGVMAERDELKISNSLYQVASAGMTVELTANKKALLDNEETIKRQAAESAALAAKLKEVYANDPKARAWADCPLPDSITCLRR